MRPSDAVSEDRARRPSQPPGDGRRTRADGVGLHEISLSDWKEVTLRVKDEVAADRLGIVSAGVAFYAFLALFPAVSAIMSMWGLFADPATVEQRIAGLSGAWPPSAADLLARAATRVALSAKTGLGLGALLSLLLTLWSANRGMKGLVEGICIAYDRDAGQRHFIKHNAISLSLTLGAVLFVVVSLALVVALPPAVGFLGVSAKTETLLSFARWPLMALFIIAALAVVYRIAPPRDKPAWRWVAPGAVVATILWLIASIAFSYYTANFGSYNEMYGSVSAVAIMLVWFFISAFIVLLGAEVNSETERQAAPTKGGA